MAAPEPREIKVPITQSTNESGQSTTAIIYPAQASSGRPAALILAHGAGAGQRHPFMVSFARGLSGGASRRDRLPNAAAASAGVGTSGTDLDVVTFSFLYAEQGRRVPDRMPQLMACYRAVIAAAREQVASARERLFIGGKSMGGRVATHVVADDPVLPVNGIVLLGYPLHPPGRPDQLRDAHLPGVGRPMLFVQGSRDAFGTPSELKPVLGGLFPPPTLHVVEGGDHSFKISGKDRTKQAVMYSEVEEKIVDWINYT